MTHFTPPDDPNERVQEAFSAARDSAQGAVSRGGEYVRENKTAVFLVLLVGLGLAALLTRKRRKEPDAVQSAREWLEKTTEEFSKQWPRAKKQARSIQDDLTEQAQALSKSLAAQAEQIRTSLAAQAQDVGKTLAAQAQEVGKILAAHAQDLGKSVAAQAQDLGKSVAAQAQEVGKTLSGQAQDIGKSVASQAEDISKDIGKKLHFWSRR